MTHPSLEAINSRLGRYIIAIWSLTQLEKHLLNLILEYRFKAMTALWTFSHSIPCRQSYLFWNHILVDMDNGRRGSINILSRWENRNVSQRRLEARPFSLADVQLLMEGVGTEWRETLILLSSMTPEGRQRLGYGCLVMHPYLQKQENEWCYREQI